MTNPYTRATAWLHRAEWLGAWQALAVAGVVALLATGVPPAAAARALRAQTVALRTLYLGSPGRFN